MEWEEIGVLWQIPLAGQTNMHYHLLLFCLLSLSRTIQTISLPSQPPFQQEVATRYRSGWISYWGWGWVVLEKPLFLNKRDRCCQYHHFPPLPVWNMDIEARMTTISLLMTMRKSLRESAEIVFWTLLVWLNTLESLEILFCERYKTLFFLSPCLSGFLLLLAANHFLVTCGQLHYCSQLFSPFPVTRFYIPIYCYVNSQR